MNIQEHKSPVALRIALEPWGEEEGGAHLLLISEENK